MHNPDDMGEFKFPDDMNRPNIPVKAEPPEIIPHPDMVGRIASSDSGLNMSCPTCGEKSVNTSTGKCTNCSGILDMPPIMDSGRNPERRACPKCGQDSFFPESNQCLSCFYTAPPGVPGYHAGMKEVEAQHVPGWEPDKQKEFGEVQTLGRDHIATPVVYRSHGKQSPNPKPAKKLEEMESPNTALLREILTELKTLNSTFGALTSSITAMAKDFRAANKKK